MASVKYSSSVPPMEMTSDGSVLMLPPTKKVAPQRQQWSKKVEFILSSLGYAVGFGNIWRFPYLVYKYGGGTFLIPFVIFVLLTGIPFMALEMTVAQYAGLGPFHIYDELCPAMKGLGVATFLTSFVNSIQYVQLLGYVIYYLFASFTTELPWNNCDNGWNLNGCIGPCGSQPDVGGKFIWLNETCLSVCPSQQLDDLTQGGLLRDSTIEYHICPVGTCTGNKCGDEDAMHCSLFGHVLNCSTGGEYPNVHSTFPTYDYFYAKVLNLYDSEGNVARWESYGTMVWPVFGCVIVAYILAGSALVRGIQTSGKVVYFTATFPYAILAVLFAYGVSLPGALDGIKFYLTPDLNKLMESEVWYEALAQVFFSLGVGYGGVMTLSSYNHFDTPVVSYAVMISTMNFLTSFFAARALRRCFWFERWRESAGSTAGLSLTWLAARFVEDAILAKRDEEWMSILSEGTGDVGWVVGHWVGPGQLREPPWVIGLSAEVERGELCSRVWCEVIGEGCVFKAEIPEIGGRCDFGKDLIERFNSEFAATITFRVGWLGYVNFNLVCTDDEAFVSLREEDCSLVLVDDVAGANLGKDIREERAELVSVCTLDRRRSSRESLRLPRKALCPDGGQEFALSVRVAGFGVREYPTSISNDMCRILRVALYKDGAQACGQGIAVDFCRSIRVKLFKAGCICNRFIVFSVLGYIAQETNVPIDSVAGKGLSLTFISFPTALAKMAAAPVWSVLFFAMLVTVGLDTQMADMETQLTAFFDEFPTLRTRKSLVVLGVTTAGVLGAMSMSFQGGIWMMTLLNDYAATAPVLIVSLFNAVIFAYLYGVHRLFQDMETMVGPVSKFTKAYLFATWKFSGPATVFLCLMYFWGTFPGSEYDRPRSELFPGYINVLGMACTGFLFIIIPVGVLVQYYRNKDVGLRNLFKPTAEWMSQEERKARGRTSVYQAEGLLI
ncbi:unnamed protein product [Notodromas monacha]|uniref:Transporter n=1 Tax=Notodromas monacha TaxID=399045 RepID=A0A7R9BWC1_9CRUS|nr:unnamed protein product [Notodromas monacha]CAG0921433.1 unnamed protein product [Notodromas monacha]